MYSSRQWVSVMFYFSQRIIKRWSTNNQATRAGGRGKGVGGNKDGLHLSRPGSLMGTVQMEQSNRPTIKPLQLYDTNTAEYEFEINDRDPNSPQHVCGII